MTIDADGPVLRIGCEIDAATVADTVERGGGIVWNHRGLRGRIPAARVAGVYEAWRDWRRIKGKRGGAPPDAVGRFTWAMVVPPNGLGKSHTQTRS